MEIFNEHDLTNSVCVFASQRYNDNMHDLQGELFYEEGRGIWAEVSVRNGRKIQLSEQDIIDGAAVYLDQYHNFDPDTLTIELLFEEDQGISAVIEPRSRLSSAAP